MKFKKVAALLLAGVMCAATVVGCGSNNNENTTTPTKGGSEATKDSGESKGDAETKAPESGDAEKITLKVWGPAEDQNPDFGNWLETRCKAFNEEHPEWDITFEYGVCSEADAPGNIANDPEAAADVYMFANDQLAKLLDAGAIARLGGETETYIRDTNAEIIVNSVSAGEGVYGVPFTGNTWFMYYDKRYFDENDVKSLDTMLAKDKVAMNTGNGWYLGSFFAANGCTWFGDGTDESAGIDFTGDKATQVVEALFDLAANPNFVYDTGDKGVSLLRDGEAHACFSGTWDYANMCEAIGAENVGVANAPTFKINGEDKQLLPFYGSKAIGVNKNTSNMKASVALALYLANEDSQMLHYELRSVVPCNTKLLTNDKVKNDPLCIVQNDVAKAVVQPAVAGIGKYWTPTETLGKKINAGKVEKKDAAQLASDLNDAINKDAI